MRLKTIATFGLGKIGGSAEPCVSLNIVKGSVIDFKAPSSEIRNGNSIEKIGKQKPSHPPSGKVVALVAKAAAEKSEKKPPDTVKFPPIGEIAALAANAMKKSVVPVHDANARVGAIVNAANERCLGGGGVDGAINNAGGFRLWRDREALPLLSEDEVRCHTGRAVATGPNRYGSLRVNYVIHAVGPVYFRFSNDSEEEDTEETTFAKPDSLLRSAYQESLERCRENGITDVAFSLLSAGVYRGERSLHDVLRIGVLAIRDWVAEAEKVDSQSDGDGIKKPTSRLQSVTLCGFSESEVEALVKVCQLVCGKKEEEQK